jgi:tetratricopeptide (TPR) repeat protein
VLESLLKSDPRDAPARMVLASLEEKAGNFAAAGEHYELVLAADPNHAVAHNNLASLLVAHTGNIEAALAHATKAYELAPGSPEINDTLGWIYYKMQVYQSAVPYLETAVKLLPNAIHKTHLGLSYHELGRDHLAVKTIAEALALQPDLAEAQAARLKVLTTR